MVGFMISWRACKSTDFDTFSSYIFIILYLFIYIYACVCVYYKLFPYFSFGNIPLHFKQGAIPLVTGGWPTKRPVARAVNVPADSSWVLVCAAGMSKK